MIYVKIKAGLGNQMFQYAFGMALSLERKEPLYLDIYYYKRKNLNIKKAESTNLLNADTSATFLIAVKTGDKDIDKIKNKRLICSSFPEWLKKFNFNQWVERTTFWDVYEVDNL